MIRETQVCSPLTRSHLFRQIVKVNLKPKTGFSHDDLADKIGLKGFLVETMCLKFHTSEQMRKGGL